MSFSCQQLMSSSGAALSFVAWGSSPHVAAEMFKAMTGVEIAHIPYSTTSYFPDLISGQVQMMFAAIPGAMGFIRNNQLRAIAVTTEKRADALPDVPTVAETVPGYENSGWYAILAPAGTPALCRTCINSYSLQFFVHAAIALSRLANSIITTRWFWPNS